MGIAAAPQIQSESLGVDYGGDILKQALWSPRLSQEGDGCYHWRRH